MNLAERLKWLRKKHDLASKKVAATAMNIKYGTYQRYEYGATPSRKKFEEIATYYKCSLSWLMTGEGDPYPKADGAAPPAPPSYIKEVPTPWTADGSAPAQQFNIMEDLDLAARVLGSGTHYAAALHLNIRSFSGAISAENTISKCHEDLRIQGEMITKMQSRLDELDKHNNLLREEIKELRGSRGGSPPIALGMDHAALTGTDDPGT